MVNPRVPVATKDVFAALGLRNGQLQVGVTDVLRAPAWPDARRVARTTGSRRWPPAPTISKRPAMQVQPVVGEVIAALSAHATARWLARMSGSGATCFAIFGNDAEAKAARAGDPAAITRTGGCMRER